MPSKESETRSLHQVIVNDDNQFVVWPAQRRIPIGWRHLGRTGTKAELTAFLREMFVETLPSPLLFKDGRVPESQWD